MNIKITGKYLVFPTSMFAVNKEFSFYKGEERVYRLDVRYDAHNPDFFAYVDVSRFAGQVLSLVTVPEIEVEYRFADEIDLPDLYKEPYRPLVHFTTKNGWINDPNGLVYANGRYYMFYQHNPCYNEWGNMHWGHAVSDDLVHWEEKGIALFPNEYGTQFSGSAIKADRVKDGFFKDKPNAICLFHTMTNPFSQWMSYSEDNFETIRTYGCVLPHVESNNRDPKVVFCPELDSYVMVFFIVGDTYTIYTSQNLTEWTHLQDFNLKGDNECPDLFPLTNNKGERKWVLIGAREWYTVGDVKDGKFVFAGETKRLHLGSSAYAGQTFSGTGDRIIRMVWDRWFSPCRRIKGQMGIPMDLSLNVINNENILCVSPIKETEVLKHDVQSFTDVMIKADNTIKFTLENSAYSIKLTGKKPTSGTVRVKIFGMEFAFEFAENRIKYNDTSKMPVSLDENMDINIIADRDSLEIFANTSYLTECHEKSRCDYSLPYFSLETDEDVTFDNIEISPLYSIWK